MAVGHRNITNKQIENDTGPPQTSQPRGSISRQLRPLSPDYLREAVSSHLEEGDFRGAIRLASASDTLAPHTAATLQAVKEKHPSPPASHLSPLPLPQSLALLL